jgi:hypothetical protein
LERSRSGSANNIGLHLLKLSDGRHFMKNIQRVTTDVEKELE